MRRGRAPHRLPHRARMQAASGQATHSAAACRLARVSRRGYARTARFATACMGLWQRISASPAHPASRERVQHPCSSLRGWPGRSRGHGHAPFSSSRPPQPSERPAACPPRRRRCRGSPQRPQSACPAWRGAAVKIAVEIASRKASNGQVGARTPAAGPQLAAARPRRRASSQCGPAAARQPAAASLTALQLAQRRAHLGEEHVRGQRALRRVLVLRRLLLLGLSVGLRHFERRKVEERGKVEVDPASGLRAFIRPSATNDAADGCAAG
jgi:hypothetical protein